MSDLITIDPAVCGGAPCFTGTRLPVRSVNWMPFEQARQAYPQLTIEQYNAAQTYDLGLWSCTIVQKDGTHATIEAYTGDVCIGDDESAVWFSPDQIPNLIAVLQQAQQVAGAWRAMHQQGG